VLELPFMHAGQPILAVRGRWADPRVAGNTGVMQGTTATPSAGSAPENATLRQRIRDLTAGQRTLEERLQAARFNNRFLDKRIAGLEARLLAAEPGCLRPADRLTCREPLPRLPGGPGGTGYGTRDRPLLGHCPDSGPH
jgi:hypothetical protein